MIGARATNCQRAWFKEHFLIILLTFSWFLTKICRHGYDIVGGILHKLDGFWPFLQFLILVWIGWFR